MTMKLREALLQVRAVEGRTGQKKVIHLACGFTPLHLSTFLLAYFAQKIPDRKFEVEVGQYGDLVEAISSKDDDDVTVVVVEYADLDPRLGLRRHSGWKREAVQDTVPTVAERLERLYERIKLVKSPRVVIMPPTLPLPPVFSTNRYQISPTEISLRGLIANFLTKVSLLPNVVVCSPNFGRDGAPMRDVGLEMAADFPYSLDHASAVANTLANAAFPPAPLKGIITDLDDTLWRGLVGEVGSDGVHWTLDGNSQIHALYQQLLNAVGEQGVLIGIASKNELEIVSKTLKRSDILLDQKFVYPIEAHWQSKSSSVARILEVWNVLPDSVAYIDDNPMELEEVSARFPTIKTFLFPNKASDAYEMLCAVRELTHKESISPEDVLRLESIRNSGAMAEEERTTSPEEFLKGLHSRVTISFDNTGKDGRALELVNKTNQFNINGNRFDAADWKRRHSADGAFTMIAEYVDKFGPLGKIGVMFGRLERNECIIDGWVLSCRAFSRRVEYAMLKSAIDTFDAKNVVVNFLETDKNKPSREFLLSLDLPLINGISIESGKILSALPQILPEIEHLRKFN